MKRVIVLLTVSLVLCVAILPSPASAGGNWRGGHRGGHGVWWPGAFIGGLALGAVAVVTAPIVALSAVAASRIGFSHRSSRLVNVLRMELAVTGARSMTSYRARTH